MLFYYLTHFLTLNLTKNRPKNVYLTKTPKTNFSKTSGHPDTFVSET